MQKPSLGRIVLFVDTNGEEFPAVVTRVHRGGAVNLRIFADNTVAFPSAKEVPSGPVEKGKACWVWPPRV